MLLSVVQFISPFTSSAFIHSLRKQSITSLSYLNFLKAMETREKNIFGFSHVILMVVPVLFRINLPFARIDRYGSFLFLSSKSL